jgi:DNA-binding transcriptional regulator GbsR (MarR family)
MLIRKDVTMDDLFAYARSTDPTTSHAAAASVDATALEQIVLDALYEHGQMTMEETANVMGKSINSLGPRFRPLLEKNMIYEVLNNDSTNMTRAGVSGRQRQVYWVQQDKSLWCERPLYMSKNKQIAELKEQLAEANEKLAHYGYLV